MATQRFFRNPHFLTYARLLRQLHQLIREGADETEEGESLRQRMDEPAEHLTPEEVDCLNAISADFYTLGCSPAQSQPGLADVRDKLREMSDARHAGDYPRALDLVRKNEAHLDPAVAANFRGRVWSEAGAIEIARDFFTRTEELAPENSQWKNVTS